jgi:acyl-CoA hydrolase
MRAVAASPAGRTILVLPSTAQGNGVSRIVPFLSTGAGDLQPG